MFAGLVPAALSLMPYSCLLTPSCWPSALTSSALASDCLHASAHADGAVAEALCGRALAEAVHATRSDAASASRMQEAARSQGWVATVLPAKLHPQGPQVGLSAISTLQHTFTASWQCNMMSSLWLLCNWQSHQPAAPVRSCHPCSCMLHLLFESMLRTHAVRLCS